MKESFEKLKAIIAENAELVDAGPAASDELIKKAEDFLGASIPQAIILYLKEWGTLSIGPFEFYGLTDDNFTSSRIPNGVWFTESKREVLDIPRNLFVVYNDNGDEFHCVDLETDHIVTWVTHPGEITSTRAPNIFDYIIRETEDFV